MIRSVLYRVSYIVLLAIVGCDDSEPKARFSGQAMGTTWQVTLVGRDACARKDSLQNAVAEALSEIESVMSHWRSESVES